MRRRLTSFSVVTLMILGLALSGCAEENGSNGPQDGSPTPELNDTNETSPGGFPNNRM